MSCIARVVVGIGIMALMTVDLELVDLKAL
jgi:hypothetical protein